MPVHELQTNDAFQNAISEHKSVFIDFFALWCGPCKVISPIYASHSNNDKFKDIHFTKIDVDKMSSLADELDIQAMPTFVLFKDGKKAETLVDPTPQTLLEFIEKGL